MLNELFNCCRTILLPTAAATKQPLLVSLFRPRGGGVGGGLQNRFYTFSMELIENRGGQNEEYISMAFTHVKKIVSDAQMLSFYLVNMPTQQKLGTILASKISM